MPVSVKHSPSPPPPIRCYGNGNTSTTTGAINGNGSISLTDFLIEAELDHYEQALRLQLKIMRVEHLKDVRESDLTEISMSKPEQRRLMKTFHKYFPSSLASKFKQKVLNRKATTHSSVANSTSWNNAPASTSSMVYNLRRCNSSEDVSSTTAAESVEALKQAYAADDTQTDEGEQHIIPASNIILCRQLGRGEFGTVWQGVWTTSSHMHSPHRYRHRASGALMKIQVAVKQISPEKMHSSTLDFVREAAIMHRIHHENVVRFFGVVFDTQTIMLVTELAPSRSLAECLKEDRSVERFSIVQLCDFAQQICSGMSYLETNRFIHRDLAARNILVFSSHKVKISDFGLSRALGTGEDYYRGNFTANLRLPIAWCAPECINYLKFTSASDVWAFGVTLWEMFTYGFQPWVGMNGQEIFDHTNAPKMGRLECPDLCPQEFYNLMSKCWQHEPEQRPKFVEILSILPTIEPERVITVKACYDGQLDHLQYGVDAVITVLSKRPSLYPDGYYWKGALKNGRTGLFLPTNTVAYLESQRPGMPATSSLTSSSQKFNVAYHHKNQHHQQHHKSAGGFIRTAIDSIGGLTRRSTTGKAAFSGGLKEKAVGARPMISLPQNDLRHTGHLGLDGLCFGDVPTQINGLPEVKHNIPKRTIPPGVPPHVMTNAINKQRLQSNTSETTCLLNHDDDEAGEENGTAGFMNRAGVGNRNSGPDLDEVRPVNIVCADTSCSLLDEVWEALDQRHVTTTTTTTTTRGGCTNIAARFSTEDAPDSLDSPSRTEPPISPSSIPDDDENEDTEMGNDKKLLWTTASSGKKLHTNGCGKMNKEKSIKLLSQGDLKLLNDIDKAADKLSTKALERERDRLYEERRKLGLLDDLSDTSDAHLERSPSPSSDTMKRQLIRKLRRSSPNSGQSSPSQRKPTFTDSLAMKCDASELRVSPEAENAYKTLIEGKGSGPTTVLLPREERDDPQRPSVEEDHDDHSTNEDDTNPLRMLRNEGANVVRRFTRQGSGRRQQHVEKPTPPVRRKHMDGLGGGAKPAQPSKSVHHVIDKPNRDIAVPMDSSSRNGEMKSPKKHPPPPVPPRSSPRLDSNRRMIQQTEANEKIRPPAPTIPPKPKFNHSPPSRTTSKKPDSPEKLLQTKSISGESLGGNENGCPSFTLDDVNKYDLLNFVLSGLPDSTIADERQKLIGVQRDRSSPRSLPETGKNNSAFKSDSDIANTAIQDIIMDDDVIHV